MLKIWIVQIHFVPLIIIKSQLKIKYMTSNMVKQRAELFIKGLLVTKSSEIKEACKKEIEELKAILSLSSVRSALTFYRKEAQAANINIIGYLSITKKENDTIQKAYSKSISKQHKQLIKISDFEGAINKAKQILETSESVPELTAALCFLTGRRMVEILKTAKFTNYKKSQNIIYFSGQAKKGGAGEKYTIYILDKCKELVKDALKRIRETANIFGLDNDGINRRFERTVNAKALQIFGGFLGGRCTCHDLRKAYSTIATRLYKDEQETVNSFLSKILGHSSDDLTTANSYQKYFL